MTDIMLDIETLSTRPNAVILTIGAIKFNRKDPVKDILKMKSIYLRISHDSCVKAGLHVDPNTVKWWNEQSKEARYEALENNERIDLKDGLILLTKFVKDSKCIWANSPNFDCVILENAYRECGLEVPWKFWNLRDCRTVYDLGKVSLKNMGETKHNSLEDCYKQILCLQNALTKLNF